MIDLQKKTFPASDEELLTFTHKSGRRVYYVNKDFRNTYAVLGVNFGSVDEQFELSDTPEQATEDSDEPYIDGYQLDVDALVRNELFVHMPLRVLCKEDCKGICKRCGTNLNLGTCDCDATELDPRMAAILDIFNGSKKS